MQSKVDGLSQARSEQRAAALKAEEANKEAIAAKIQERLAAEAAANAPAVEATEEAPAEEASTEEAPAEESAE